jgi:hypothetical protein
MSFFSRLFKKAPAPDLLTCPRCLGKGHVDTNDIIRLNQQGKWGCGTCAYCKGTGVVDKEMVAKIPADATYLTTNLSEFERDAVINTRQRDGCPVSELNRIRLERAVLLLLDIFGRDATQQRRVLIPNFSDFPILYEGTEQAAHETLKIVAAQMDVPYDRITLGFFDDNAREVSTGSPFGDRIFLRSENEEKNAAGYYFGRTEDDKYEIWLSRRNLTEPEGLVATLAHEIAHIKLLGEERMTINDEPLTDLTTIIFGLGIFNANEAFRTFKNFSAHGWRSKGYLSQPQWAYALALFAFVREEESPMWMDHLTPNVKSDFLKGQQFILNNPDLIFQYSDL